jgi:hypothetical protein
LCFAQGENVKVAQDAGADAVGGKELADKVSGGWLDFDVAIATPDMMGVVGPLGKSAWSSWLDAFSACGNGDSRCRVQQLQITKLAKLSSGLMRVGMFIRS